MSPFSNPWPGAELHGFRDLLKWRRERRRHPPPRDPDPSVFRPATPDPARPRGAAGDLRVTWVGHSTVLLQLGDRNILTDPVWSDRASPVQWGGPARWVRPGLDFDDLPPIDLVLLSHNHYDHFDNRTIRRLARRHPDARWAVPLGLGPEVRRRGAKQVEEFNWWDTRRFGGLIIGCTPAQHFSARTFWDRNRTLWAGWTVRRADGQTGGVYFAGDTGYFPGFGEIGRRFGPFDLALVPIGAYEPRWFMKPVHMNPEEAVEAVRELSRSGGRGTGGRRFALRTARLSVCPSVRL